MRISWLLLCSAAMVAGLPFSSWMQARAQVASTTSAIDIVNRAGLLTQGSLLPSDWESDVDVRLFVEETVALTGTMDLDIVSDGTYGVPTSPGTVASGTTVTSIMLHSDALTPTVPFEATVEFSSATEILGVVLLEDTMDDWDTLIGVNPDVDYPDGVDYRGCELDGVVEPDSVSILGLGTAGLKTVAVLFHTGYAVDELRVILAGDAKGVSFSIDIQGPSDGTTPSFGATEMTEGDILTPGEAGAPGPNPPVPSPTQPPGVLLTYEDLGVTVAGLQGAHELDALSFGKDGGSHIRFSVDEFAVGSHPYNTPDVRSEGALPGRSQEASADIFAYRGHATLTSVTFRKGNQAYLDGDGLFPTGRPGFKLTEPNPPTTAALPDTGDNVDAFDYGTTQADLAGPVYFSLDGDFRDWAETAMGPPPNYQTATRNGFCAGDVLVADPLTATVRVWISAEAMGLICGTGLDDDIDALSILENGDGDFQLSADRILFSLRRNSPSLGRICPRLGIPITEADILTFRSYYGDPEIVVPGESMGLNTSRTGYLPPTQVPDDLDALDIIQAEAAPVSNADSASLASGGTIQIDLLANDGALIGALVPASLTIFDPPLHGVVDVDSLTGTVTYHHDGQGMSDAFTYYVFDDRDQFSEITPVGITIQSPTGAEAGDTGETPGSLRLDPNAPNPFNPSTRIVFALARSESVELSIYTVDGARVRVLVRTTLPAGQHTYDWNGRDDAGQLQPSGVYVYQLTMSGQTESRRMTLLR